MSDSAVWDRAWYAQTKIRVYISVDEALELRDSSTLKAAICIVVLVIAKYAWALEDHTYAKLVQDSRMYVDALEDYLGLGKSSLKKNVPNIKNLNEKERLGNIPEFYLK